MSSYQLDTPERGFGHSAEGPLDMRMDDRNKLTAARILDKYAEPQLAQLFREYGELKQAAKLARKIASVRRTQKIESTTQLRALVEEVCHWIPQRGKIHPASKVFQALRIEVNGELDGLGEFLAEAIGLVGPGDPDRGDLVPFPRRPDRQAHPEPPVPDRIRPGGDRRPDQASRRPGRGGSRPESPLAVGQAAGGGEEAPWFVGSSTGKTILWGTLAGVLAMMTLTFYVWHFTENVRLGYEIAQGQQSAPAVGADIKKLRTKRAALLSLERVDRTARQALKLGDRPRRPDRL